MNQMMVSAVEWISASINVLCAPLEKIFLVTYRTTKAWALCIASRTTTTEKMLVIMVEGVVGYRRCA